MTALMGKRRLTIHVHRIVQSIPLLLRVKGEAETLQQSPAVVSFMTQTLKRKAIRGSQISQRVFLQSTHPQPAKLGHQLNLYPSLIHQDSIPLSSVHCQGDVPDTFY